VSADSQSDVDLEVAHVLFLDVVGYSKLLINEQAEVIAQLNQIVRATDHFRRAEAANKLIRIPTGDGMALAFFNSPEAPVQCAIEICRALHDHPHIRVRMGIHSGPVNPVTDVNDRSNIAGAGMNTAQRIMDCADAGHILLSKRVADDLAQYAHWQSRLHDLGDIEVKHGNRISVVNLHGEGFGNSAVPARIREQSRLLFPKRVRTAPNSRSRRTAIATVLFVFAIAIGAMLWSYLRNRVPVMTASGFIPQKKHRGAAVRQLQRRQTKHLLCRRYPG